MVLVSPLSFLLVTMHSVTQGGKDQAERVISATELETYYYACTRGLSTWWSTTTLQGEFILGEAWRLDAFSAYPFRT